MQSIEKEEIMDTTEKMNSSVRAQITLPLWASKAVCTKNHTIFEVWVVYIYDAESNRIGIVSGPDEETAKQRAALFVMAINRQQEIVAVYEAQLLAWREAFEAVVMRLQPPGAILRERLAPVFETPSGKNLAQFAFSLKDIEAALANVVLTSQVVDSSLADDEASAAAEGPSDEELETPDGATLFLTCPITQQPLNFRISAEVGFSAEQESETLRWRAVGVALLVLLVILIATKMLGWW
jgi:hypothetical protein